MDLRRNSGEGQSLESSRGAAGVRSARVDCDFATKEGLHLCLLDGLGRIVVDQRRQPCGGEAGVQRRSVQLQLGGWEGRWVAFDPHLWRALSGYSRACQRVTHLREIDAFLRASEADRAHEGRRVLFHADLGRDSHTLLLLRSRGKDARTGSRKGRRRSGCSSTVTLVHSAGRSSPAPLAHPHSSARTSSSSSAAAVEVGQGGLLAPARVCVCLARIRSLHFPLHPLLRTFSSPAYALMAVEYTNSEWWRSAQAYLWQSRHRTLTAALYALVFTVLDLGCTANFWMAYARGTASFVPLPDGQLEPNDNDDDEEATLGLRSASSQLAKFVRPTLDRDEEEERAAAHDESLEQQEQTALLLSGATSGPESKRGASSNNTRRAAHQVKSDGSARFCRKVTRFCLVSERKKTQI